MDVPLPHVLRDFCPLMSSSPYKLGDEYYDSSGGNSLGISYPALNYQLNLPVKPGHSSAKSILELDDHSVQDVITSCAPNFSLKRESHLENKKKGFEALLPFDHLLPWEHKCSNPRSTSNTDAFPWNDACTPPLYDMVPDNSNQKRVPGRYSPVTHTCLGYQLEMNMWKFPSNVDEKKTLDKMQGNCHDNLCIPEDTKSYDDPLEDFDPWYFGERDHDRAYTPIEDLESQESYSALPDKSDVNFDGISWFDPFSAAPRNLPNKHLRDDNGVFGQNDVKDIQEIPCKSKPSIVASIYEDVSSDDDTSRDKYDCARFKSPAITISKPSADMHLHVYSSECDKVDPGILCNISNLSDFSRDSSEDDADDEMLRRNCPDEVLHIGASPSKNDDSGIDMNCSQFDKVGLHFNKGKKVLIHHRISVAKKRPMPRDNYLDASSEEEGSETPVKRKRRFCRKPTSPKKSATPSDPKFKGVTFQVKTKLQENESQLSITAYFNCGQGLAYREQSRHAQSPPGGSFLLCEDSDSEGVDHIPRDRRILNISGKQCASCGTRKTPLWRDAEDGTPLCNACGIRYRKYRIRCGRCWYIPKKDNKMQPFCANCGEALKFSMFKSKNWC